MTTMRPLQQKDDYLRGESPITRPAFEFYNPNKKLYNRQRDIEKLADAYLRRTEHPQLVLLVGQPGNGKTTLGHALRPYVAQDKGFYAAGRFDPLDYPEPYGPIVDVCEQLIRALDPDSIEAKKFAHALQTNMKPKDIQAIATLWPDLSNLLPTLDEANAPSKANSLVVAILQILRAMSRAERPIAVLVDDLHFAERASLEVLKLALADPKISIFCMVAFRPVNVQHPSSVWLQTLEAGGVKFLPLVPSPVDNPEILVGEWMRDTVSEKLGLPPDQLQTIGQTIAKDTQGNACAIQLCLQIMALNDEIVRQTGETPLQAGGDVRSLFQLLFMMLSPMSQKACWTASCMGMVVDAARLKRIFGEGLDEALEEAEQHGVLQFVDTTPPPSLTAITEEEETTTTTATMTTTANSRDSKQGYYAFANLTYRDCVYGLIAPKDRNMQHTAIGNIYRQDIEKIGVFRVVEHLSLGRELLSPKQIQAFARVCLTAGDLANKWGEFQSAARHYDLGVDLLDTKQKWKADYHLVLPLYNGSAAVYSSLGEFEEMDARLMEILNHAKDTTDKVQANIIQVKALVVQTRHSDAIALGLKVLPKLEEPVKKYSAESELKATRKLLEGKSEERILCSPTMQDEKKVGAMEIMNSLLVSALVEQGDLITALACRIVKATLRYGLSGASAVGLCMLGAILCFEGEVDDGLWCSNAGLDLIEMIEDKSCKGRVMAIHWGLMVRFVQSLKSCQEPLKVAYRLCVEGGDNDVSFLLWVLQRPCEMYRMELLIYSFCSLL
jgi:predicted ATPase